MPWATAAVKAVLKCTDHVDVSDIWVADFNVVEPAQSLTSSWVFVWVGKGSKIQMKTPQDVLGFGTHKCRREPPRHQSSQQIFEQILSQQERMSGACKSSSTLTIVSLETKHANDFRIACCFLARFAGGSEVLGNGAAAMMWDLT